MANNLLAKVKRPPNRLWRVCVIFLKKLFIFIFFIFNTLIDFNQFRNVVEEGLYEKWFVQF